ncbi:MAG: UDP-N-acetylmuramoyl-tripeptide--D-alanyl-D-alanine ligase, partial [Lachnospiraceae bacterium]|nr:UDP-N-acetylmuramoyl-tripeptide--D-alanyl-D-alanine ligase [Lachnospiraceae bacterium]
AKSEVIPYIKDNGVLILNDDDEYLTTIKDDRRIEVLRYGIRSGNTLKAKASEVTPDGSAGIAFKLKLDKEERDVSIPIPGEHNVYNALAAAVTGVVNKLNIDEIKKGIESIKTLSGRNNKIEANGVTIFDDCYNANPVSMKAALSVLKDAHGRKIAVLGDMGELGDSTEELHYGVGEYVGECGIDMIVLSGTLSRKIAEGALTANPMQMICHFDSVDEMTEFLKEEKRPGDTILVKASHFMKYEHVVEALKK